MTEHGKDEPCLDESRTRANRSATNMEDPPEACPDWYVLQESQPPMIDVEN